MLRVVVVSGVPALRAGLRALLSGDPACRVVGEASSPEAVEEQATGLAYDVAVVEATAAAEIAALEATAGDALPGLVLLGPLPDEQRLPALLDGRAWAYLPRDASAEQLLAAVHAVGAGLVAIDPAAGGHLLAPAAASTEDVADEPAEALTPREREVLQLVALGLPNKTIATRLGISEHTVKFHVAAILAKLGAGSRTEAVHLGIRRGLVTL